MDFGSKLAALRKAQGWNQEELAARMEVSRQAVSKWESGQSLPEMEKVLQLCDLFHVSTDTLLRPEQSAETQQPGKVLVSGQQAQDYLDARAKAGKQIAAATLLCVLSPICMLALTAQAEVRKLAGLSAVEEQAGVIGLCALLVLVAAAVVLFIRSGGTNQTFAYLDGNDFILSADARQVVLTRKQREQHSYMQLNAIGAALAILSVIPLLASAALHKTDAEVIYGLCIMLCVVGAAVVCFVWAGVRHNALMRLLQEEEFSPERRQQQKRYAGLSAAYWLAATAVYLAWSLPQDAWQQSWIVWPVAGVVFAALRCLMHR